MLIILFLRSCVDISTLTEHFPTLHDWETRQNHLGPASRFFHALPQGPANFASSFLSLIPFCEQSSGKGTTELVSDLADRSYHDFHRSLGHYPDGQKRGAKRAIFVPRKRLNGKILRAGIRKCSTCVYHILCDRRRETHGRRMISWNAIFELYRLRWE